jgi:Dolichyl-phosphate-mannose-protein mannosyltransferase
MVGGHSRNLTSAAIAGSAMAEHVVAPSAWGRLSIALAAILALAAVILCYEITEPFVGHHDWNSAWMSSAARNHLRYGYTRTRLAVIENNDLVPPEWFRYYTDHPPLVPLFVSLVFRFIGEHEWAARLVPIMFSLGSTVLVYLLGVALGGRRLGLLSAFVYALLPMTAYFGRVLNHEAPTNFFALATALAYLRWHQHRLTTPFVLALIALVFGALCDWPGYYLAGILPLHHLLASGRGRREWKILLLPLAAILLFGLHLGHIFWLQGSEGLSYLVSMFLLRTHLYLTPTLEALGVEPNGFTWARFLALEARRAGELFTPPVLILVALSLYNMARRRGGVLASKPLFTVMLLLFGTTHVVLFSHGAWEHDYWLFYYSAALALLAADGALSLAGPVMNRSVLGFAGVLFVLAVLPRIQSLHSRDSPSILALAPLLKEHIRPGEQILTNAPTIYGHAPELGYYGGYDVSYLPIIQILQLERVFATNGHRPLACLLLEEGQGAAELGPWLSSRYPSEPANLLGKRYRIFHIDEGRSVSMD